jgi:hypothetical protein
MQKVFGACLAVLAGITASGALAQTAYPPADDYGGGAPTLLLPDGWNDPENSRDGYGSSEASPAEFGTPDGAPVEEGSGEQDAEGGH